MLPRVVIHNEVSLDGRMDWLNVDLARFYGLVARWQEDVTLTGSETLFRSMPDLAQPPGRGVASSPASKGALLAAIDGQGRLPGLALLREQPYWRDVVSLCTPAASPAYLAALDASGVQCFKSGSERVDLRAALEWLAQEHGARVVRADCGGALNAVLLRAGLVSEVSVLIEPRLVGGSSAAHRLVHGPDLESEDGVVKLKLQAVEQLEDDVVWLRYEPIS